MFSERSQSLLENIIKWIRNSTSHLYEMESSSQKIDERIKETHKCYLLQRRNITNQAICILYALILAA